MAKKTEKGGKFGNVHCRTWNIARKLKIMENEKYPLISEYILCEFLCECVTAIFLKMPRLSAVKTCPLIISAYGAVLGLEDGGR